MSETLQNILAEALTGECAAWGIVDARIAANGMARRVLETMRQPTPEMLEAGNSGLSGNGVNDVQHDDSLMCWEAMIDAALNPSPTHPTT
jgi:hypothetical protein